MSLTDVFTKFIENNDIKWAKSIVDRVNDQNNLDPISVEDYRKANLIYCKYNKLKDRYKEFIRRYYKDHEALFRAEVENSVMFFADHVPMEDKNAMFNVINELPQKASEMPSLDAMIDILIDAEAYGRGKAFSHFLSNPEKHIHVYTTLEINGRPETADEKDQRLHNDIIKTTEELNTYLHDELPFEQQVKPVLHDVIYGTEKKPGLKSRLNEYSADPKKQEEMSKMLDEVNGIFSHVPADVASNYYNDVNGFQTSFTGAHNTKTLWRKDMNRLNSSPEWKKFGTYLVNNNNAIEHDRKHLKEDKEASMELARYKVQMDPKATQGFIELVNKVGEMYQDRSETLKNESLEQSTKIYTFKKLDEKKRILETAVKNGDFASIPGALSDYRKEEAKMDQLMAETKRVFSTTPEFETPLNLDTIRNKYIPWKYSKDYATNARLNMAYQTYLASLKLGVTPEEYIKDPIGCVERKYQSIKSEHGVNQILNNATLALPNIADVLSQEKNSINFLYGDTASLISRNIPGMVLLGPDTPERQKNRAMVHSYGRLFTDRNSLELAKFERITRAFAHPFDPENKPIFVAVWGANLLGKADEIRLGLGEFELDKDNSPYVKNLSSLSDYEGGIDLKRINSKIDEVERELRLNIQNGNTANLEFAYGCQSAILEILKKRDLERSPEARQLIDRANGLIDLMPNKTIKKQMEAAKRSFTEYRKLVDLDLNDEDKKEDSIACASVSDLPDIMKKKTSSWRLLDSWKTSPQYEAVVTSLERLKEVNERIRALHLEVGQAVPNDLQREYNNAAEAVCQAGRVYLQKKEKEMKDPAHGSRSSYEKERVNSVYRLVTRLRHETKDRNLQSALHKTENYKARLAGIPAGNEMNDLYKKKLRYAAYAYAENIVRRDNYDMGHARAQKLRKDIMDDRGFQILVMTQSGDSILKMLKEGTLESKLKDIRTRHELPEAHFYSHYAEATMATKRIEENEKKGAPNNVLDEILEEYEAGKTQKHQRNNQEQTDDVKKTEGVKKTENVKKTEGSVKNTQPGKSNNKPKGRSGF